MPKDKITLFGQEGGLKMAYLPPYDSYLTGTCFTIQIIKTCFNER